MYNYPYIATIRIKVLVDGENIQEGIDNLKDAFTDPMIEINGYGFSVADWQLLDINVNDA